MTRRTIRTLLAVFALAIVAVVPAIASAHKSGKTHSSHKVKANVGTVTSFTDGTLVVSSGGMPVSGKVTLRTKIRWTDRGLHRGWSRGRGHKGHASNRRHHGTEGGMPTAGGVPTAGGLPPYGHHPRATAADLKPGAVLRNAKLVLTPDGPVWQELVLVRPAVTPAA